MKRKGVLLFVLAAITAVSLLGYFSKQDEFPDIPAAEYGDAEQLGLRQPRYVTVIDPGHGGEDGGAISISGVNESGINLDICLKMGAFMRFLGVAPVMTRETDISIHDQSANTIAEKKASDLRNRAKMVGGIPNSVLLSVHQNEFEQSEVKGAEVYYNTHEKSKAFAEHMQSALISSVDPENRRASKKIGTNYLMNNVDCPAILIECGFISNPSEEAKLLSKSYQIKLAAAITVAYLNWTEVQ